MISELRLRECKMSLEHIPTPESKKMFKNDRLYQKDTGANLKRPTLVKTGITGVEITQRTKESMSTC